MFHDLIPNTRGKNWCGPSALAMVCNISYNEAVAVIRDVTGKKRVTGTTTAQMRAAFDALGWSLSVNYHKADKYPTFRNWLDSRPHYHTNNMFLIVVSKCKPHWVLVKDDQTADSWSKKSVPLHESKHLRKHVMEVYTLVPLHTNKKEITLARIRNKAMDHLQKLLTIRSYKKMALEAIHAKNCKFNVDRIIGRVTIDAPDNHVFYDSGCSSEYFAYDDGGLVWKEIHEYLTKVDIVLEENPEYV